MMRKLLLILLTTLFVGSTQAQNWNEIIKTNASDRNSGDFFGWSVAISGNYAIVSAQRETEDVAGLNTMSLAGSAYILEKNLGGAWVEVQKIVPSDREAFDFFGTSVAISGNFAVVGAYNEDEDAAGLNTLNDAGSAYIFERNVAGTWIEVQKIVASDRGVGDCFGQSVAISGAYIVVGVPKESEDAVGLNTLNLAGSAYIFERNVGGVWSEVQKIVASDRDAFDFFGTSVAISGNYAVVGAKEEDEDAAGLNPLPGAGSVYVFERNIGGTWNEVQKLVASDRGLFDFFGTSLSISSNYAIVGAESDKENAVGLNPLFDAGSVYIFERNGSGTWNEVQKLVASDRGANDKFGATVSISGNLAIVGSSLEDEDAVGLNTLNSAGSAYVFERNGSGTWNEAQKLVASDRAANDRFGFSVAISGNFAIVGAYSEDEDTAGLNTLSNAGAAYVFSSPCSPTFSSYSTTTCSSYTVPSNDETYTAIGTYTVMDTISNSCGEDSIMAITITILPGLSGTQNDTVCFGESIIVNGTVYNADNLSGTEVFTNIGANNCDSIVTVTLTINPAIDTSISKSGSVITSNQTGATYQWIDCANANAEILGETNASYTATSNGDYAVIVTKGSCSDTSACVNLNTVSVNENNFSKAFSIYPNPTSGLLILCLTNGESNARVEVYSVLGQQIKSDRISTQKMEIDLSNYGKGIYFVQIQNGTNTIMEKVVKQ